MPSSSRRPLSAIFLGAQLSTPDSTVKSTASGLPSPPATNSTGSGSAGDTGSIRQSPHTVMSNENKPTNSSTASDDDDENEIPNDEDNTARLNVSTPANDSHMGALQRVKSLAQRNRMAIDKLSSFSRLSTPSPASSSRLSHLSRSPLPPPNAHASSSRHNETLSGSETERESQRAPTPSNSNSFRSVSPELSTTPPPLDTRRRQRITSAPSSPNRTRQPSPGPSRTPRKRVSMASHMSAPVGSDARGNDVADAALAAVASSRRSPTATGSISRRSRQPLPREFRDSGERRSLDGRPSIEPMTPHRAPYRDGNSSTAYTPHEDLSPRTAAHTAANASMTSLQYSPRGLRTNRSSTVRDLARRHQPRWLSDDISTTGSTTTTTGTVPSAPDSARRQTQRGGSAESALSPGSARLAGESLRAAGIAMRTGGRARYGAVVHDRDADPFADRELRRAKSGSGVGRVVEWEDEERLRDWDRDRRMDDERSRTSGSSVRESEAPPSRGILRTEHSRSASTVVSERDARSNRFPSSRPATSMGMGMGGGEMYRPESSARSRRYDLPEGTLVRRNTSMTPVSTSSGTGSASGSAAHAEHTRLMVEALSMFQAALARLPGQPPPHIQSPPHTAQSQIQGQGRDLQHQAETLVRAADRLNALMRAGTAHAVQQQIAIEVDEDAEDGYYDRHDGDPTRDPARIWRDVGADYREGLRESDEIVRTLTGFILGVGRVLKETAAAATAGEGSKEHMRSTSLDGEAMRRRTPDSSGGGTSSRHSQDGRRSVESRRSWDPAVQGDLSRRVSSRGDREYDLSRPPSSALQERERDRGSASNQDRRHLHSRNGLHPLPPPPQSQPSSASSSSSTGPRRLLSPREMREQQHGRSADVVDLSMDYEPSPTPASRHMHMQSDHRRIHTDRQTHKPTLPLSTPPPLHPLPSETFLRKSSLADKQSRRKVSLASLASITTVRAASSPFALSTSSPTTAVTAHTVSGSSPEIETAPIPASASASVHPLTRSDSRDSARSVSASSSYVTFSRPSEVSVSALQQLQHSRDTVGGDGSAHANSNANANAKSSSAAGGNQMRSPLSGSETERDYTRRRTIGVRAARMSLDGAIEERENEGGSGGARTNTITLPSQRRERRRTVTEIFG